MQQRNEASYLLAFKNLKKATVIGHRGEVASPLFVGTIVIVLCHMLIT